MKAVDTNVLVYAHRREMPMHDKAFSLMKELAEGKNCFAIPWPCLHEFYSIVTNPRIFQVNASTPRQASEQISAWLRSPVAMPIGETDDYEKSFIRLITLCCPKGPLIHDARILLICEANEVECLFTMDRDFSKFPSLVKIQNPFI